MTPDELRATIPALSDVTYPNTDAHSPSPRSIAECAIEFLEYHEYESPGDDGPYPIAFDAYEAVREDVAAFIGAKTEEVALTQNTTDDISHIATVFDWEPGNVVVRTDLEHPAGIFPWRRPEHEGVEVRVVESEAGRFDMDQYAETVDDADLVYFSSLTWNYGARLPVRELTDIARDAGAPSVADAIQSFGQYPIAVDDWGADIVAGAGHEWPLGPWGTGFLYVRREIAEGIEPHTVGYRGVTEPNTDGLNFTPGAKCSEIGATDPVPHVALREVIDIAGRVGLDRTEGHVRDLAGRLIETVPKGRLLSPHDPESGLVSFEISDPEGTAERFESTGVVVRTLPGPTAARASLHNFNDESDMATLHDGLDGEQ